MTGEAMMMIKEDMAMTGEAMMMIKEDMAMNASSISMGAVSTYHRFPAATAIRILENAPMLLG